MLRRPLASRSVLLARAREEQGDYLLRDAAQVVAEATVLPCQGGEAWAGIPGTNARYAASSLGRIGSMISRSGRGKVLAPFKFGEYWAVGLVLPGFRQTNFTVHTLVALAFHGVPSGSSLVRHLDDDKNNNTTENLAWGTGAENGQDAVRNGRTAKGVRNGSAVLTEESVAQIRDLLRTGWSQQRVASHFGVSQVTVCRINTRKLWGHVA